MLYVIHRGNHPELAYHEGQEPILHFEADLHRVIRWAETNGRRWAFSLSNAGSYYAEFRSRPEELDQLDWEAISAVDFRHPDVKEGKQAEFLAYDSFPFDLVDRIGACSAAVQSRATGVLVGSGYRPPVELRREWYF